MMLILILLFMLHIAADAAWDAEAFKKGESNHVFKWTRLVIVFLIGSVMMLIGNGIVLNIFLTCILIAVDYMFLRLAFFDDMLNFFRQKSIGYKTGPWWFKWICAIIGIIVLPVLIFYI